MVLDNAQVLNLLVKKVFGSLLLNLDKWPIGVDACFSIGRTYFYDRSKRRAPINQAAAEKIKMLYRCSWGLTPGFRGRIRSGKLTEYINSFY